MEAHLDLVLSDLSKPRRVHCAPNHGIKMMFSILFIRDKENTDLFYGDDVSLLFQ